MASFLRIQVRFLTGCYHGEEWPPSPMRLLQALVAGCVRAGTLAKAESLLSWLQELDPPRIYAPVVEAGPAFIAYVPRNSDDLTLAAIAKGAAVHEVNARRRARYDAQPTSRRWVDGPIVYEWRTSDPSSAQRVGQLSHELICLGRAEDLAFARFEIAEQPLGGTLPQWSVATMGPTLLRTPAPGSVASLLARERARRERNESRQYVDPITLYGERFYGTHVEVAHRPWALYELRDVASGGLLSWRQDEALVVAAMVRHALHTRVPERFLPYALGHVETGNRDDRLSWLPLPSLEQGSDGRIRRVLLLGAPGEAQDSRRFREIRHALANAPLVHRGVVVGSAEETDDFHAVQARFFGPSVRWHTATPLVTHGRTTRGGRQKGKFVPHKAVKLIVRALEQAGLPPPVAVTFQSAPLERSGRAARSYRVPSHLTSFSRFHVAVAFAEPVRGPIVAGPGRHYGLGLFCTGSVTRT